MNDSIFKGPNKPAVERLFYSIMAVLLLILTVAGFKLFYFQGKSYPGRELAPPIRTLVIAHGVAMTIWILLSVAQPALVASGNRRLHMAIGRFAAVLAAVLVALGIRLGIAAEKIAPPGMMFGPLTPKQFLAVPVLVATLFGLLVAAGVWWRKRPEIHRPLMFMATLTAVAAAISRIDSFNHLYAGTIWQRIWGDLFFTVAIGGVILLVKSIVFRSFDKWFAGAYAVLALWFMMIAQGAGTQAWDRVASFLLG